MFTNKQENGNAKKNSVTQITILIIVISLIVIAALLASSNLDFVDSLMRLHGG